MVGRCQVLEDWLSTQWFQFVFPQNVHRYNHCVEHLPIDNGRVSGEDIAHLMRKHKVTIRELAERTGITMKRIREVRAVGLEDRLAIRDWIEAIVGSDPGPI
jgi:hypothetical protein